MDVQHFTTNKLINDLKSRSYLAVLVMVIGLALGLTKDYFSIIAENRWWQFFGGFELTAVGLILLVAIRKQMKAVNGLRVEIHDTLSEFTNQAPSTTSTVAVRVYPSRPLPSNLSTAIAP